MSNFEYPLSENALIVRLLHEVAIGEEGDAELIDKLLKVIVHDRIFKREDFALVLMLHSISKIMSCIELEAKMAQCLYLLVDAKKERGLCSQLIKSNVVFDESIIDILVKQALFYGINF